MKKRLLCLMASLLLCGAVSAQAHFEVDTHAKDNNMPVVAQVVFDGVAITTGGYELGAFVGDATEARGSAQIQTGDLAGTYWIQVYYTSFGNDNETGATVTFKLYDGTDEYTAETTLDIDPEGYGTLGTPQVIVVNRAVTQTSSLAQGWTWWSTPVELSGMSNALQQLEACISQYGIKIQSQIGTVTKRPNGNWVGGSFPLENERCYKIQVSDASIVSFTGSLADPNDHTITLNNGWNWIGYPVNSPQSVSLALANFEPENGDVIMGQGGTSTYRGGQWRNPITLTPGYGYLYNSKATESKSFVYSVSRTGDSPVIQEEPFWNTNIHKYENCMAIIAVVYIGEDEQFDDSFELGTFVDGTCTGSAKMFYLEEENRYYAILTTGGNDGDKVSFGMVNEAKGILYNESNNKLTFSSNSIVGDFDQPYEIHFGSLDIGESILRVAMYPNPVDRGQAFKLNIPEEEKVLDVTIVNALGSVVRHEEGALTSTITGLPVAGVYTVKVYCHSGNTYYGKLVVK